jgi:DNA-directed RNA polymerase specialized sigma24 family protein
VVRPVLLGGLVTDGDLVSSPAPHVPPDLLAGLHPDRQRAEAIYTRLRVTLVRLFEWQNCRESEELADETLSRGLKRLASGTILDDPDNPTPYFIGVGRYVLKEYWKRMRTRAAEPIEDHQELRAPQRDLVRKRWLEEALAGLDGEDRRVFVQYFMGDRIELSESLGISNAALRIRIFRIRGRLRQLLSQGGTSRQRA